MIPFYSFLCTIFCSQTMPTDICAACSRLPSKKKKKKCTPCTLFEVLVESLTPQDLVYIRNAVAHGYKTFRKISLGAFNVSDTKFVNRKRREVAAQLLEWRTSTTRESDDLDDDIPVGCARYLVKSVEFSDIAKRLKVFNFAQNLLRRHHSHCGDECVQVHSGEGSSIRPLRAFSALLSSIGTAAPADLPLFADSQPSTSTLLLPSLPLQQQSLSPNDDEPIDDEGCGRDAENTLPLSVCNMLVRINGREKYSFNKILANWQTANWVDHAVVSNLLADLNREQCQIEYSGPNKLPLCSKTLLKIDPQELTKACPIRPVRPAEDAKIPEALVAGPLGNKDLIGEYIHFGLKKALLGTSPGLIHRWEYIATLRRIHAVFPDLLPVEFVELTRPQLGEEGNQQVLINHMFNKLSLRTEENDPEVNKQKSIIN
jgi:hypothetical protein